MATTPQVSPRAAPPSRALARPVESLLPQLVAERCLVDITLMSSESPRHQMRYSSRLPTLHYSEGVDRVFGGLLPSRDFACSYGGELEVVEFLR